MTPYFDDGQVTLYLGDCRDVLPLLEPKSVDLVLTDPPYNAGKNYGQHNDTMSPEEYEAWCASWFTPLRAFCKRTVMTCGHGHVGMWYRIQKPSAIGCWYKPGNGASSIIGFEEWEPWLYWHGGNKGLLGGSSVIRQPLDTSANEIAARAGHPCPKPIGLMKRLLIKCRSKSVIDPFVGSGTTLVAAKELGVRAIGIELEEKFCELTAKRLSQQVLFTEQSA